MGAAALIGAIVGVASVTMTPSGRAAVVHVVNGVASAGRPTRERPPMAGDHWGGCNDARRAGTAPIYHDEPGYRTDMDGDGDGIACEPRPD